MAMARKIIGLVVVLAVAIPVLMFVVRRLPDNVRALYSPA